MIKTGETFSALVRDIGSAGHGIVEHPSGQVFFVPGVWVDEQVTVRVDSFKRNFGHGSLVSIEKASPHRREPPCQFHGTSASSCGGCPWQSITYSEQLRAKQQRVETALARLGVEPANIQTIEPSDNEFGYRNRAQFKTDGARLGYVAGGSRRLVDVSTCEVLSEANQLTLASLRESLPNSEWRPQKNQNTRKHKGRGAGQSTAWSTVDIDEHFKASVNQRLPFRQANDAQNIKMRDWLGQQLADVDKARSVVELFAGSGNFTDVLASLAFNKIYAIEVVAEAIESLAQKQLSNVETHTSNLYEDGAYAKLLKKFRNADVVVLDPPRDGLKNASELFQTKSHFKDVIYISCDLATFTRDAQCLLDAGFKVKTVQPIDLFPQTAHVEIMAHFRK